MIKEIRETEPFIHLGFSKQEITVYKNEVVTIWQDKVYNKGAYFPPFLFALGSFEVEKTRNYFKIYFTTTGSKVCKVSFSGTISKFVESNEVTINVVERTFGATNLFWGDEIITFND
jgi:hypothetical protein